MSKTCYEIVPSLNPTSGRPDWTLRRYFVAWYGGQYGWRFVARSQYKEDLIAILTHLQQPSETVTCSQNQ